MLLLLSGIVGPYLLNLFRFQATIFIRICWNPQDINWAQLEEILYLRLLHFTQAIIGGL